MAHLLLGLPLLVAGMAQPCPSPTSETSWVVGLALPDLWLGP